jgi:putative transposase
MKAVLRCESAIRVCTRTAFEFRCENDAKLRATFARDCRDHEAICWVTSPTGYSGDDIRDLMLESVENRFCDQLPVKTVERFSDKGSAYTAEQTRWLLDRSACNR